MLIESPKEEEIIKNNSPEIRREVKHAVRYSEMLMTRHDKKRGDKFGPLWDRNSTH